MYEGMIRIPWIPFLSWFPLTLKRLLKNDWKLFVLQTLTRQSSSIALHYTTDLEGETNVRLHPKNRGLALLIHTLSFFEKQTLSHQMIHFSPLRLPIAFLLYSLCMYENENRINSHAFDIGQKTVSYSWWESHLRTKLMPVLLSIWTSALSMLFFMLKVQESYAWMINERKWKR